MPLRANFFEVVSFASSKTQRLNLFPLAMFSNKLFFCLRYSHLVPGMDDFYREYRPRRVSMPNFAITVGILSFALLTVSVVLHRQLKQEQELSASLSKALEQARKSQKNEKDGSPIISTIAPLQSSQTIDPPPFHCMLDSQGCNYLSHTKSNFQHFSCAGIFRQFSVHVQTWRMHGWTQRVSD
jgi:hypothetical protein